MNVRRPILSCLIKARFTARLCRRVWPLFFLFICNGAYAITVSTTPVTMLPNGTGYFTISWTGAGYTSTVETSLDGGYSWVTTRVGFNDSGSATFTQGPGIWRFRIMYCNFVMPYLNFVCRYTSTYTFSVLTPPATPTFYSLIRTSSSPTFSVATDWPVTATRFEWQERKDGGTWTNLENYTSIVVERTVPDSGAWGYRVRACNDGGCSAYSAEMVMYVALAPGVPGSLSVPGTTYGSFTASWGAASGSVTRYDLDIRNGSGGYSNAYDGSALSSPVNVSQAGTYYLQVRACRTTGTYTNCSDWRTSSGVVALLPPVPVSFSVSAINSGQYTVSWGAIPGVTRYTLLEQVGSRRPAPVQDTNATSKIFPVTSNGRYSYQVRSCAALGCSSYTSPQTVNVVRARTGAATETVYNYDALGRLQFVGDTVNGNRDFDYDSAGNRTAVAESVLDEDEDPFEDEPVTPPAAPTGLWLAGPFSQAGGYTASWLSTGADRYVVGMEDGSRVETTQLSIGTAILRPVWVYAVKGGASSAKSYF